LTQEQFDALVMLDFTYPLSQKNTPKLLGILNTLNLEMLPVKRSIVIEWRDIGGAPGLAFRRFDELQLFFSGDYNRDWNTIPADNRMW
jgi:hypothetical protein